MKHIDLTGKRFGRLVVIKRVDNNKREERLWLCSCDCGKEKIAKTVNLMSGKTTHCGCSKRPLKRDDSILGKKFNRLTVISFSHYYDDRSSVYNCICDCGNKTKTRKSFIKNGRVKSCGCYIRELTSSRMYNPDVPDEVRIMWRIGKQYDKWVKDIRNKYNNQCDICKNNKKLVSHHIKNWLSHPELRFNIENGVCLCKECHYKFHSIYGLINNTPEQYFEYKESYNEHAPSSSS